MTSLQKKTVIVLILAGLMFFPHLNEQQSSKAEIPNGAEEQAEARKKQDTESKVTVVFAGLMFFSYNAADGGNYTAGILRAAIDHTFRIFDSEDVERTPTVAGRDMELEVTVKGTTIHRRGATATNIAGFDRMSTEERFKEDFRYVVDFDVLYPETSGGYRIDPTALSPNILIRVGRVYTKCKTTLLTSRIGNGSSDDFGSIAEEIGVEIFLQPNEVLELKDSATGYPILYEEYQQGTNRVIYITNLPSEHPSLQAYGGLTHFQNYYLFVSKPFSGRHDFSFKVPGEYQPCPLPGPLKEHFKRERSPSPYFCGIGYGNRGTPIH